MDCRHETFSDIEESAKTHPGRDLHSRHGCRSCGKRSRTGGRGICRKECPLCLHRRLEQQPSAPDLLAHSTSQGEYHFPCKKVTKNLQAEFGSAIRSGYTRRRALENSMSWIRTGFLVALSAVAQSPNAPLSLPGGTKNPASFEFVKIAPGEFVMGCAEGDKDCLEDEVPRHRVRLTRGF